MPNATDDFNPTPTTIVTSAIASLIELLPANERPTIAAFLIRSPLHRHPTEHAVAILNDCAYDLDLAATTLIEESNARADLDGQG